MGALLFHRSGAPIAVLAAVGLLSAGAYADSLVYFNDFEADTNGFTAGGALPALERHSLPTDGGGLASPNQSTWLGPLGAGVSKGGGNQEIVTLNVSGLTPGSTYHVLFDLFIGASWDGMGSGVGPDRWQFLFAGSPLVDTSFSNVTSGVDAGAYSPQRYSDTFYSDVGDSTHDVSSFTGADVIHTTLDSNYAGYYGIYYFGHGAGNPVLDFVAEGNSHVLTFARFGDSSDSPDEYWALDNVRVLKVDDSNPQPIPVPLPAALPVASLGLLAVVAHRYRRPLAALRG